MAKVKKTDFEKSHDLTTEISLNLEGKKGFDLYKSYRDFFIEILSDNKKSHVFTKPELKLDLLQDLTFFDPAYIDNFILCLSTNLVSPEIYKDNVKIIDKYVRPKKVNEGSNYFYQEAGAFFALCLNHYKGASERYALNIAGQLVGFSESRIDFRYRKQKKLLQNKLPEKFPDLTSLIFLFLGISKKKLKMDNLKSFKKHARSEAVLLDQKRKYDEFVKDILTAYYPFFQKYVSENPDNILFDASKEFGINLKEFSNFSHRYEPFSVFVFLVCIFAIKEMPNKLDEIKEMPNILS